MNSFIIVSVYFYLFDTLYQYMFRLDVIKSEFIFSLDNEVFAWGNNAMGQCGQGHAQSPVTRPRKVIGLDDARIQQISAGTSHSVATTAFPYDR